LKKNTGNGGGAKTCLSKCSIYLGRRRFRKAPPPQKDYISLRKGMRAGVPRFGGDFFSRGRAAATKVRRARPVLCCRGFCWKCGSLHGGPDAIFHTIRQAAIRHHSRLSTVPQPTSPFSSVVFATAIQCFFVFCVGYGQHHVKSACAVYCSRYLSHRRGQCACRIARTAFSACTPARNSSLRPPKCIPATRRHSSVLATWSGPNLNGIGLFLLVT